MRIDTLIRKSTSWSQLFTRLQSVQPKIKGDVFERVVQLYLQTHPEYETQLSSVWLLEEVPRRIRAMLNLPELDEGIDLIAETVDHKYWAIQAKFRSNRDSRLTNKADLATFTALAFHTCDNIDYGLICATTSQPLKKVELVGTNTGFRLFSDFSALDDHDCAGWKRLKSALGTPPRPPKKLHPMWHQKRAIKNAYTHYLEDKQARGKMIMPCGTGKSLTAFWIAQKLDAKLIVVGVPSLALIKQTLNVWTREYLAYNIFPEWICVCSDTGSGVVDADEFTAHTYDLGVPTTTDTDEIAAFLRKRTSRPRVVFTTYQSGPVLASAAKKANRIFDPGIMDEAHKTVGRKDKALAHLLHEENIRIRKRLFMTATERQFIGSSDDIVSMDDPDIYGDTFEQLSFREAISAENPIISDYRFVTIGISEQEIKDLWDKNKYLRVSSDQLDEVATRSLAAGLALRKAYSKFNVKRAISFHGSIRKAENFKKQQQAITELYPELAQVECHHVSSRIPTSKRTTILHDFAKSERGLITNARCLTEGVDIPSVDCVLFADPRRSTVDIVQAAGRAMRRAENKKYGYIIVPLVVPEDMDIEEFAERTEFKEVVKTIRPLAINDDRIVEYFRAVAEGRSPASGPAIIEGDIKLAQSIDENSFVRAIELKVWDKVAKISWRPFGEAREYVRGLNLKSNNEWLTYTKSGKLPSDIPTVPERTYKDKGWVNWGDWLGTGNIAPWLRQYRSFKEARAFARGLNLKNGKEWNDFTQSDEFPSDIPIVPYSAYKDKGWVSWGDWLGTDFIASSLREYRSFEEARAFARSLNLKGNSNWRVFTKSGKLPSDVPSVPDNVYKDDGWTSWGDWLGTGTIAPQLRQYRPFKEARAFAQALHLKKRKEWNDFTQSDEFPSDIPVAPDHAYKDKEWISWGDWLGTDNIASRLRQYRSFNEARAFARSLNFKSQGEWLIFSKSDELPPDIPATPSTVYKDQGWIGFGDWLGTGFIATHLRTFRSFTDARAFVRGLNLKSRAEWTVFTKSGGLPPDIPTNPSRNYKGKGWINWGGLAWYGQYCTLVTTVSFIQRGKGWKGFKDWLGKK
ncbi:hypothetical protein BOW42_09565 [Solemya velum gill symbiont]|nr:hypothetical protein BOW42_09565 [Solemya velum gill symbiont]